MFWVYGGGFIMGDATEENYLPGPLLDTGDVIIVTGNYRVGPLGFMCLEDEVRDILFVFLYIFLWRWCRATWRSGTSG